MLERELKKEEIIYNDGCKINNNKVGQPDWAMYNKMQYNLINNYNFNQYQCRFNNKCFKMLKKKFYNKTNKQYNKIIVYL